MFTFGQWTRWRCADSGKAWPHQHHSLYLAVVGWRPDKYHLWLITVVDVKHKALTLVHSTVMSQKINPEWIFSIEHWKTWSCCLSVGVLTSCDCPRKSRSVPFSATAHWRGSTVLPFALDWSPGPSYHRGQAELKTSDYCVKYKWQWEPLRSLCWSWIVHELQKFGYARNALRLSSSNRHAWKMKPMPKCQN